MFELNYQEPVKKKKKKKIWPTPLTVERDHNASVSESCACFQCIVSFTYKNNDENSITKEFLKPLNCHCAAYLFVPMFSNDLCMRNFSVYSIYCSSPRRWALWSKATSGSESITDPQCVTDLKNVRLWV